MKNVRAVKKRETAFAVMRRSRFRSYEEIDLTHYFALVAEYLTAVTVIALLVLGMIKGGAA
jgi:hypothetical protein